MGPHIALREAGIEHELVPVLVAERQNYSPSYLTVNPRGRVPALAVDGKVYTEVPALLLYIASLNPRAGLLPAPASDAYARALEWLAWISSSLHVGYAQIWRPERFLNAKVDPAPFTEEGAVRVRRFNLEIEARIGAGWLAGDRFSVADAYLLPFYRWGHRIGQPMRQECPKWRDWVQRVLARPAVRDVFEIEGLSYDMFDTQNG